MLCISLRLMCCYFNYFIFSLNLSRNIANFNFNPDFNSTSPSTNQRHSFCSHCDNHSHKTCR